MLSLPQAFLLLPPPKKNSTFAMVEQKRALLLIRQILSYPEPITGIHQLFSMELRRNKERIFHIIRNVDIATNITCLPFATKEQQIHNIQYIWKHILFHIQSTTETFLWHLPMFPCIYENNLYKDPFENKGFCSGPNGLEFLINNQYTSSIPSQYISQKVLFDIDSLPSLHLSLYDSNPLSQNEDHPEKSGNSINLGNYTVPDWIHALQKALTLIQKWIPEWYNELSFSLQRIIPVGFFEEQHVSASYKEAVGLAYMSLHPDPLIMAEAIIHETQHNKINSLLHFDPLLNNGHSEWTTSPVRPDLRPISGVFLALHAFLPVEAMLFRLKAAQDPITQTPSYIRRYKEIHEGNRRALDTIVQKGQPSAQGKKLMENMILLSDALNMTP